MIETVRVPWSVFVMLTSVTKCISVLTVCTENLYVLLHWANSVAHF